LVQLQEIEPRLKEMGYRIIAVTPDKPEEIKKTLDKKKLTYTLLSDSKMDGAKAFGIAFKLNKKKFMERMASVATEKSSGETHHLLPVPAVFLIGADGVIDFVYANPDYTVRLQPDALLAEAEKALK
jgi:peroxiredoxin